MEKPNKAYIGVMHNESEWAFKTDVTIQASHISLEIVSHLNYTHQHCHNLHGYCALQLADFSRTTLWSFRDFS